MALHFVFIAFALLGSFLVLWKRGFAWLHLPALAWGTWIEASGNLCPLTPLEKWLRREGNLGGYEGGFVEHYILPVLYPQALTRNVQLVLGLIVVLLNLFIYRRVLRGPTPEA